MESSSSRQKKVEGRLPGAGGGGNGELVVNGHRVSGWEDAKVLEMDGGDSCTTV